MTFKHIVNGCAIYKYIYIYILTHIPEVFIEDKELQNN